jgi:hypothetical protein
MLSIYLIATAPLGHGAFRNSMKIEYQRYEQKLFQLSRARPMRETNILTAICKPIVLTIWDPQYPTTLWASTFTGTALLFYMQMMFVSHRKHIWSSTACYEVGFLITFSFLNLLVCLRYQSKLHFKVIMLSNKFL